jgi:ferredoxin-fold anticodon binding domain-containing protein
MTIQDLRDKQNLFGKLVAKSKANQPIITYGFIRYINDNHIIFEDSEDRELTYKVHSVESFGILSFKRKSKIYFFKRKKFYKFGSG